MIKREFEHITNTIPILLVDDIFLENYDTKVRKSLSVIKLRKIRSNLRYIVLNWTCDDLPKNLLYACLYQCYPDHSEETIENIAEFLYLDEDYKKIARKKIIELFGDYKLDT